MSRPVPRELRICLTCGSEFSFRNSPSRQASGRGKFCSRSCGTKITSVRHGHARDTGESPTYSSYRAMLSRCYNEKHAKFQEYGGRGIMVCNRWVQSFENFLADMGERPPGTTIDRWPDKEGNYTPTNCRWASPKDQQRNLKNNRVVEFNGKAQCISAWVVETGLSHSVISYRLRAGWPVADALQTPARLGNRVASN